ncbi:MAG: branched-chain amino acid ABC transporter permease [Bacteroidota bacterium]
MRSPALQKGIRTGAIFGIVIVVMFLIGFTVTGAGLLGKLFGATSYSTPSLVFFFLFMGLIGIWAGMAAAPGPLIDAEDTFQRAAVAGTAAGSVSGLFAAAAGFFFGSLIANKIDPRTYLPSVSPESIRMFLFNQSPLTGSLMLLALLTISGLAGAALAFFLRTNERLKSQAHKASNSVGYTLQSERVTNITQNRYTRMAILMLLAIVLIVLPRTWGSYWNYVFGTVGIYIILGLGLNIITGWSGQLVLGYVAFFAIGAYTFALLTAPEPHHLTWNFWIALGLAVLAAAIVGLLLGLPILNLRGDYLAIVTLGFAEIIRILLKSDLMTNYTAGPRGIRDIAGPSLFGKSFASDVDFMYLIIIGVLVVTFLARRLKNSRTGKAWFAINLDETVARATGVNAFSSKLLALALSAGIAGLAGAVFASRNQFTGPDDHAMMVSINVLCLLIVGGIGSIPGIFLGAFILKGLPEILRETENFRLLIFGILLIVMMRLRPEGFLPARRPQLEKVSLPDSAEKDGAS